jgi:hypothetical protein
MSDRTTGELSPYSRRCGPAGAALELVTIGAREMVRVPMSLLKLPIVGVQQVLVITGAIRRGYEDLALRGLQRVGLLCGSAEETYPAASSGGYAVGDAEDGAFAEFDAEFDALLAETDADLARQLDPDPGTDIGGDPDVDGEAGSSAELPVDDFDHVTAGSLRGRLRRLDLADLRTLRLYEQGHGQRQPILTLLENRIAKLEASPPG